MKTEMREKQKQHQCEEQQEEALSPRTRDFCQGLSTGGPGPECSTAQPAISSLIPPRMRTSSGSNSSSRCQPVSQAAAAAPQQSQGSRPLAGLPLAKESQTEPANGRAYLHVLLLVPLFQTLVQEHVKGPAGPSSPSSVSVAWS